MESTEAECVFSGCQMKTFSTADASDCRHYWLLGQPAAGYVRGVCKKCDVENVYPAFLEEQDAGIDTLERISPIGAATAAGGARPSSVALPMTQERR